MCAKLLLEQDMIRVVLRLAVRRRSVGNKTIFFVCGVLLLLHQSTYCEAGLDGSRFNNFISRSKSLIRLLKAEYPGPAAARSGKAGPVPKPTSVTTTTTTTTTTTNNSINNGQDESNSGSQEATPISPQLLQGDQEKYITIPVKGGAVNGSFIRVLENGTVEYGYDPAESKTFTRDVCHKNLGCFSTEWGPMSHLNTLPVGPDDIDVGFLLYRNDSRTSPLVIKPADVPILIENTTFDTQALTKFVIHGYMDTGYTSWIGDMADALFDEDPDMNIFAVDWGKGAHFRNYVQSAANSELVGRVLANFISDLSDKGGVKLENVHIIGFSLGAQVAGHAANWLKQTREGALVGRITGLEPAAPLFVGRNYPNDTHLDASDAIFVDIIHTNGQPLWLGGQGAFVDTGHVDFYPNGGLAQPGCRNLFIGAILDLFTGQDGRNCNHRRAHHYFTESIKSHREKNCRFVSFPCPNLEDFDQDFVGSSSCFSCGEAGCGEMGYFADKAPGRGKQYLLTHGKERTQLSDFCGEMYRLTVYPAEVPTDNLSGQLSLTFMQKGNESPLGTYSIPKPTGAAARSGSKLSSIILLPSHQEFDEIPALIGFKADSVRPAGANLASFFLQGIELESEKLHLRYYLCVESPEPILSGTQVRKLLKTTPCNS